MIDPGAEGGLLFNIPAESKGSILEVSPRFQLIDDNSDESRSIHTHKSGASYDIYAPLYLVTNQVNEYNHSRLVKSGNHIEHWMNGIIVLKYELDSDDWYEKVLTSIYARQDDYGQAKKGKIALYSKTGRIVFRNFRIKEI